MKKKVYVSIVILVIVLAVAGLLAWLFVDLNVAPKFEIENSKLIIKDTYKAEIDLTNAEIKMSSDKLELTQRVVGTSSGSVRKGKYKISGVDDVVYLSMMKYGEEYIFIQDGAQRYYINMNTAEATLDLYYKLLKAKE